MASVAPAPQPKKLAPTTAPTAAKAEERSGGGGGDDGLHQALRERSFDEGEALLAPKADEAAETPAAPSGAKEAPPAKTRAQVLREQKKTIARIKDLLGYGAFDWQITDSEAKKAMASLEAMAFAERRVVLEEIGKSEPVYLSRMFEELPAGARKSYGGAWVTLLAVMGRVESLHELVQGPLAKAGLAPGRHEAEIALVVEAIPPGELASYATLTMGAQVREWVQRLPEGHPAQASFEAAWEAGTRHRERAQEEADTRESRKRDAAKTVAGDAALKKTFDSVEDLLSYGVLDWAITDAEALKVLRLLNGISDPAKLQSVVFALDAKGVAMDRFIDNLAPADRWNNARAFLSILLMRDASRTLKYVQELLDGGVSDEEARLVFRLAVRMPPEQQVKFRYKDGGTWWKKMAGEVDETDLAKENANFFNDDEKRAKAKEELEANVATWDKGRLDGAIGTLLRMDEADFVEATLNGAGLAESPDHGWAYEKYGFARPGGERDPKRWGKFVAKSGWDELGEALAETGAALEVAGDGLSTLAGNETSIDLEQVETMMGGNIAGVDLAERKNERDDHGTNRLTVKLGDGRFQGAIPKLTIAAIHQLDGTTKIDSGPVTIDGVAFDLKWGTKADPRAWVKIDVASIAAADVFRTTPTAIDRLGRFALQAFRLEAERAEIAVPDGLAEAIESVSGLLADVNDTVGRLVGGIGAAGADAGKLGASLSGAFTGLAQAKIAVGGIDVENAGSAGGPSVGAASLKGLTITVTSRSKDDAARERLAELAQKPALSPAEEAQRAALAAELPKLTAMRARLRALEAKEKQLDEGASTDLVPTLVIGKMEQPGLSLDEQEELRRLRDALAVSQGEVTLDSLRVEDVEAGDAKVAKLAVTDLSAKAVTQRGAADAGAQEAAPLGFGSVTAKVELEGLVAGVGKTRFAQREAAIAAMKEAAEAEGASAEKKVSHAEAEAAFAPVRARWAERMGLLEKAKAGALSPEEDGALKQLSTALAPWLEAAPDVAVGKASLGQVDATIQGGKVAVRATDVALEDVALGDTKAKSAKVGALSADASGLMGGGALRAGLAAEQVDLEGVEKGVAGQAGHAKVDKAHVGAVAGSYDAGAAGGTVVASAKDVALEGIAATSESRLAALKHQIAVLEAEAAPADPAVHAGKLAKARRQMKAYERLEKQQRAAKTKAAKARAAKALAAWSEEVELTVREAGVTDVDVRATGVGSGQLAAEAHIAGEAHATGIKRGDLGVGSVRGQGMLVKVDATDPAMGTTVAARADHVEAEQVTAGSARVKKATLDGASLVATDERTAMGAKKAQVRGVRAGGASVASATLNDADLTTRTDARGNDHVSASARSAWAYDVRSRGKGHDARVKHVAGSGLAVSAGGGHTSASLASFKARDASVATGEGDQQSVVAADKVSGTGASFSAGGGKVRAGVKTLEGSGLAAAGAMTGGRFVTVDEAKIADASMSADKQAGSVKADVGSLTAAGVRSVKADGSEVVTADKAALGGVHVLSKDVAIEDDAGAAVVGPDGKPLSRRVSSVDVEKASVEGGAAKLTDKATGAVTEVATKKTEVEGASAMMDGSKIAGHVDRVEGDVAYGGSKPITLPNGQQVTRASGHVKATGLGGEVDTATGDVSASFGTIKANRLTFGDGDRKVALLKSLSLGKAGETSTVSLSGGKVSGDLWAVRVVTDDDVAVPIGPGLNAAVTGKLGVGRIQLKKVDPGDLAAAGSSVKIEGIAASLRIATPDGKIAWVDDAVVGQIAAQGMGGGKLAVGYDWVTAKSFGVKDGEKGKTKVENFGLRDGYAEVQLGSDPKVLTAWLGEVKGDVHVSATIDKSKAKAKNDGSPAAPAASPGTSGPKERDDLILDVLKESDLTIPMKTKGSAGLETNIEMWAKAHDGKIPLKDANISAEWGYLHAGTGDGISRSLIRNVVAPDFVAFDDAGSIDVDRTVRRLATDQGPSPDGEKDEGPSDFLTNLQVGVHSRNLKGRAGIVGKGEGRFEQGELSAGGKVADSVGAKLEYPIIRDVKVLDGLIEANRVYAEKMEVKVERPLDQTMVMKADIEAGKITGVEYGKRMSEADRKAAKDRVMQQ